MNEALAMTVQFPCAFQGYHLSGDSVIKATKQGFGLLEASDGS